MKRAIITGANGFVGAAVVNELIQHGYQIYAIGHNDHFDRIANKKMYVAFHVILLISRI